MLISNPTRKVAITVILAVFMLSASAAAAVTLTASASDVTVDSETERTSVTVEVTNTGNETGEANVDFAESSSTSQIDIEGVTGNDPTNSGLGSVVTRNGSNNDVTFSAVGVNETVTATAVVEIVSNSTSSNTTESESGGVNASLTADVENLETNTVKTVTANITTQTGQTLEEEYAGEDGEIQPRELITAIGDFRDGELTPSDIIELIDAFQS